MRTIFAFALACILATCALIAASAIVGGIIAFFLYMFIFLPLSVRLARRATGKDLYEVLGLGLA